MISTIKKVRCPNFGSAILVFFCFCEFHEKMSKKHDLTKNEGGGLGGCCRVSGGWVGCWVDGWLGVGLGVGLGIGLDVRWFGGWVGWVVRWLGGLGGLVVWFWVLGWVLGGWVGCWVWSWVGGLSDSVIRCCVLGAWVGCLVVGCWVVGQFGGSVFFLLFCFLKFWFPFFSKEVTH